MFKVITSCAPCGDEDPQEGKPCRDPNKHGML